MKRVFDGVYRIVKTKQWGLDVSLLMGFCVLAVFVQRRHVAASEPYSILFSPSLLDGLEVNKHLHVYSLLPLLRTSSLSVDYSRAPTLTLLSHSLASVIITIAQPAILSSLAILWCGSTSPQPLLCYFGRFLHLADPFCLHVD